MALKNSKNVIITLVLLVLLTFSLQSIFPFIYNAPSESGLCHQRGIFLDIIDFSPVIGALTALFVFIVPIAVAISYYAISMRPKQAPLLHIILFAVAGLILFFVAIIVMAQLKSSPCWSMPPIYPD